jgi:hypothetical protein
MQVIDSSLSFAHWLLSCFQIWKIKVLVFLVACTLYENGTIEKCFKGFLKEKKTNGMMLSLIGIKDTKVHAIFS